MSKYTYDFKDKEFYNDVFSLLAKEAGAQESERTFFIYDFCQVEKPAVEFRFGGIFGMGGKFWRNGLNRFYISCYQETETPKRLEVISRVNAEINKLVKKHNPRTQWELMKLGWRF